MSTAPHTDESSPMLDQFADALWQAAGERASTPSDDEELRRVRDWFMAADPRGERMATALRESLDQVLDGPRTMRFRYADLHKTEKTHVGTIVEITVAKSFRLPNGRRMDYLIAGSDVDCKYSMTMGGWEFPLESLGHLALVVWTDDSTSTWSAGLWRVDEHHLGKGKGNRDLKRKMVKSGLARIHWLWKDHPLPENTLLHLERPTVDRIFGSRSGQQRVNELFRSVQRRIIRREVLLTVAAQVDGPKRARDARKPLADEGIIVLGHYAWDVRAARALGLPVPCRGEWVSARIAPAEGPETEGSVELEERHWRLATDDDPATPAPRVPRSKAAEPPQRVEALSFDDSGDGTGTP